MSCSREVGFGRHAFYAHSGYLRETKHLYMIGSAAKVGLLMVICEKKSATDTESENKPQFLSIFSIFSSCFLSLQCWRLFNNVI